ncbi:putative 2EXR domain-containing protein [Seiridium unicorne]|uniref:2EXR domain-containing protein n=1 Tax=Seiridium unicorne TaxID=138068 RepID=A0ABR2UMX6_9PEZI
MSTLTSFTRFPHLPPEIRLMIWNEDLNQAGVCTFKVDPSWLLLNLLIQDPLKPISIGIPRIMQVCQEARDCVMRATTLEYDILPSGARVNYRRKYQPEIDILAVDMDKDTWLAFRFHCLCTGILAQTRAIAVDVRRFENLNSKKTIVALVSTKLCGLRKLVALQPSEPLLGGERLSIFEANDLEDIGDGDISIDTGRLCRALENDLKYLKFLRIRNLERITGGVFSKVQQEELDIKVETGRLGRHPH